MREYQPHRHTRFTTYTYPLDSHEAIFLENAIYEFPRVLFRASGPLSNSQPIYVI